MSKTKKPKAIDGVYDYHELAQYLSAKVGFSLYDVFDSNTHFKTWCAAHGVKRKDPTSYALYKAHPQGEIVRPPFKDFLGWLADFCDITPGHASGVITVFVAMHLKASDLEEWVRAVLLCLQEKFGDEVALSWEAY